MFIYRRRHLQGRRSSTRTPRRSSTTTATTATSGARRPARAEDPRGLEGQEDPLGRAAHPGHRRARATRSAASTSPATRSSRPKPCGRCSSSKTGECYSEKQIRKGLEKAREVYGAGGYFEFTGYPDYTFRDDPNPADADGGAGRAGPSAPCRAAALTAGPPIVDVTMRMQEGKQYFVNRITFAGNTTTRDNVIRREMRLVEDGVFNTEALKYSVKRLNQLGYFKPLEGGRTIDVEKTPDADNKVDVKLKLEEQNRNQLTFGAGVSQFEGFFGQLSFQTSNFLGRGESLHACRCSRAIARTELPARRSPSRSCSTATSPAASTSSTGRSAYIGQFTQKSTGRQRRCSASRSAGFARMFVELQLRATSSVKELNPLYTTRGVLARTIRSCADSLLIGEGGERDDQQDRRRATSTTRSTTRSSRPPASGSRCRSIWPASAATPSSTSRRSKAIWYLQADTRRMSLGFRAPAEYIHRTAAPSALPIFEKLFLGGEYSIRGFDIRTRRAARPGDRPGARRQQEPAVQRRVPDHDRRPGAPDAVLRRRPGARRRRDVRVEGSRHQRRAAGLAAADAAGDFGTDAIR